MPLAMTNPESTVKLAPVSNAHDEDEKNLTLDLIENSIVASVQPVKLVFAFNLLDSRRVGIFRERIDSLLYSSPW